MFDLRTSAPKIRWIRSWGKSSQPWFWQRNSLHWIIWIQSFESCRCLSFVLYLQRPGDIVPDFHSLTKDDNSLLTNQKMGKNRCGVHRVISHSEEVAGVGGTLCCCSCAGAKWRMNVDCTICLCPPGECHHMWGGCLARGAVTNKCSEWQSSSLLFPSPHQ